MSSYSYTHKLHNTNYFTDAIVLKLNELGYSNDFIFDINLKDTEDFIRLYKDDFVVQIDNDPDWGLSIVERQQAILRALCYYTGKPEIESVPEFDGLGIF